MHGQMELCKSRFGGRHFHRIRSHMDNGDKGYSLHNIVCGIFTDLCHLIAIISIKCCARSTLSMASGAKHRKLCGEI